MNGAAGKESADSVSCLCLPPARPATSKDRDEKSAGVKVNWLQQNLRRMVAIRLRRGDCVLSPKCFSLNVSLCHQLATHPCTPRRCSRQIHCSSIRQMDFYLPFYLARYAGEGKVLWRCCCFFSPTLLHGEWEGRTAPHANQTSGEEDSGVQSICFTSATPENIDMFS